MMKLEESPLVAAAAIVGHEGTPAPVAQPDRSLHLGRNAARACGLVTILVLRMGTGSTDRRELLSGQGFDQQRHGPIHDLAEISIRQLVTKEILSQAQLVTGLASRGELHSVPLKPERDDNGRRRPR